jgi:hypothetical protein
MQGGGRGRARPFCSSWGGPYVPREYQTESVRVRRRRMNRVIAISIADRTVPYSLTDRRTVANQRDARPSGLASHNDNRSTQDVIPERQPCTSPTQGVKRTNQSDLGGLLYSIIGLT